ncbi:hypothetical protein L596_001586 [Steinernema carpocapsae]|uniref:Uncharacterized protein n=1 Tax=Steinernema carpocapsae TaxID=34508 RepID=A0A4U8UQL4_STECR|nr:hypothetical protein L596_001586 [Steinernema carpocapsae]
MAVFDVQFCVCASNGSGRGGSACFRVNFRVIVILFEAIFSFAIFNTTRCFRIIATTVENTTKPDEKNVAGAAKKATAETVGRTAAEAAEKNATEAAKKVAAENRCRSCPRADAEERGGRLGKLCASAEGR